jgi:hypothetical protein
MSYTIIDLDSTISDDRWRQHHIDITIDNPMQRYHNYHLLAGFDDIANEQLFRPVAPGKLIITTSRPEFYAAITFEWLNRHNIKGIVLFRPTKCTWSSSALKQEQINTLRLRFGIKPEDIEVAYDDRHEVCAMYKKNKINAIQVLNLRKDQGLHGKSS